MGRSYHINCIGGVIDLPSQQFEEAAVVVSFPDPNPRAGKGLVTLERFHGCMGA